MATDPAFAATTLLGANAVAAAADNSWTTFPNAVDIVTGGASGSKIEEVWFQGIGVTVNGIVNLIYFDGTTNHLIDQVLFAGVSGSSTAAAERFIRRYPNLFLGSNTQKLRASSMVASQLVKVIAFGGSF